MYKNCYFVPPADDSGIPLGCAWYGYRLLNKVEQTTFLYPYLGKTYTKGEITNVLNNFNEIEYEYFEDFSQLTKLVSQEILNNKVVGWMQGGSEIGPRALGNRSIIASPILPWMEKNINFLKGREWYRPFAPAVLWEKQTDIFNLDLFSPYMLVTTTVKEDWVQKIPSVTHTDTTSRYQSVSKEINPRFHEIISEFYKLSGVPVLLNTSFNGPDEPIVETPLDAIKTFLSRKLDLLVIGNFLIKKLNFEFEY